MTTEEEWQKVLDNKKLVGWVVGLRFGWYIDQKRCLDKKDLFQYGLLGLKRAVELFDESKGCKFSTYAYTWIYQAVGRAIEVYGFRNIRIPTHSLNRIRALKKQHGDVHVWDLFLNKHIDYSEYKLLSVYFNGGVSLNSGVSKKSGCKQDLIDFIEDHDSENFTDFIDIEFLKERVHETLITLSDVHRDVIEKRFGLFSNEKTLQEVGDERGVSREYIRQLEEKALEKLRVPHRMAKLRGFL